MARITINDFKSAFPNVNFTHDFVNAILNDSPYRNQIPLATAENIADVGAGILANQTVQNEFINGLVDRIGLTVLVHKSLNNPLAKFKKGMLPLGTKIEEVFTDLIPEQLYDAELAESEVFKREIPDVKVLFHEENRRALFKSTIQDASLQAAFISWNNFESFISSIISKLYDSNQVNEFFYMKLLIDNYYNKGLFAVEQTVPIQKNTAEEFVMKAREYATMLTLPSGSRDYNAMAVHTVTDIEDLHLIIDAKLASIIDVAVLARAFNIDYAKFIGNVTVIDKFDSPNLRAVMIDKDWFRVYDRVQKMESIRNPQGLYWNYNYHVWQIMSASRFMNAVAFVDGEVNKVTQVIVSPPLSSLKRGREMAFDHYVRTVNGFDDYTVTWSVLGSDGTAVSVGTSINNDGELTIAANEVNNQLTVTCTVSYTEEEVIVPDPDDEEDEVDPPTPTVITVKGTAIVLPI